ncbi:hypothetical protein GUITHDRAFT_102581 [Guillardia theta CCMP2712]|uniref:E3 UFM1-protein ligase 1 homolog n=1 Tax=Guillardia theta (strain CCMP2712) TaxID=905079 RepID=L1JUI1_GUITC|nr:hypothetical protein GUITHDRAFT_102581 [Guillardia theta CCMP2712]EKX51969.1 hypothetical protein GUITHDRAFT_102581 [Guillardia theta CCMP2712]|eukprot:XP_005838949.1 hypothetical protein GUITHDRAFT_102581 [Guillardia theta CCMP2712]
MDEIEALQALLGAVQKQETRPRLSERNCRELLIKLLSNGLVTLIVNLDGNEYVTPEHLEKEIRDEIVVNGGRVKITDIQTAVNVDLRHVQDRMDKILSEDSSISMIDGEVLTSGIEIRHHDSIPDRNSIAKNGLHSARKDGRGMLYTDTYIERQEACIRGTFSALTRPTTLASLQSIFYFDESLFDQKVESLIKEGRIKGTLSGKGMRAVYTPEIFIRSQLSAAKNFFNQNGYIEYSTAEKMLINNPKSFLSKEFGNLGFALRSCFVSSRLVEQCIEHIRAKATADGDRLHAALKSDLVSPAAAQDDDDDDDGGRGKKKGGKKNVKEVEEEEEDGKKGKGSKRQELKEAAAKQKEKKGKGGGDESSAKKIDKGGKQQQGSSFDYDGETSKFVKDFLKSSSDDHEMDFASEDFIQEVVVSLRSKAKDIYHEIANSLFTSSATKRVKNDELQSKFVLLYQQLSLFRKGISFFSDETAAAMEKYLLKTLCTDIVNLVLESQCKAHGISFSATAEDRQKLQPSLTQEAAGTLSSFQELVVKILNSDGGDEAAMAEAAALSETVRSLASTKEGLSKACVSSEK